MIGLFITNRKFFQKTYETKADFDTTFSFAPWP
jgi:hypothetical protein